ncbi:hypothetical protein I9W82_003206 [Candida metapsilosis]|uniref:Uncharacterized protein n=1 Tax=Candida metapsilosis TaxID=273372 RepID=A0A8H7ZF78_9ASCO|nr:hypothetical protein I9W82_003206 [Candida metapsilosis]
MLSFHAAKLLSSSRESTATTATTTRHLPIPKSLPNRGLLVKQFTIGPESNLTKPLAWPKHVTKVIKQLKQADPTTSVASDTTDTTKSVDPVTTTNPKMEPAVQNTTTATSINQTSPECLPKLNSSAIENQPVESTRNCVTKISSPSENLWEKTLESVDNHTKDCEIRNEVVEENEDFILIQPEAVVPVENIHGKEEEEDGGSADATESRVEQSATDQSTENDSENSPDNSTGQVINEPKGKWKRNLKQKWTKMFTRSPSKPQLSPPSKSKFSKKVKKWFNVGKKISCPDDEGYEETDEDDEGDDDLNVPIWDIEPVPIDNPRAYAMKRRINAAFEKVSKPFKKQSATSNTPQCGLEAGSKGAVIARMKDKSKFWRKQKKSSPKTKKKSPAPGTPAVRHPSNQERDGAGVDVTQSISNPIVVTNSKPEVKCRKKWLKIRDSFKAGFARTFRRKRKVTLATDDNSLLFDTENGNVRDDKASEEEDNPPAEYDDEDIENLDSFRPSSHDELLDIDPETGQFFGSHGFLDEYYSPKKIKLRKVKSKSLGSSILKRRREEVACGMTVPVPEKSQSGHWVLDPDKGWIFGEVANENTDPGPEKSQEDHWVMDPDKGWIHEQNEIDDTGLDFHFDPLKFNRCSYEAEFYDEEEEEEDFIFQSQLPSLMIHTGLYFTEEFCQELFSTEMTF